MSVIARLDAHRARVRYFLRSFGTASFSSLKNGFPTFCTEEKFDAGDWKVLCGTTCRRRLANNREITRRFCLFSRVSVTSVHARFCEVHVSIVWDEIKRRCLYIVRFFWTGKDTRRRYAFKSCLFSAYYIHAHTCTFSNHFKTCKCIHLNICIFQNIFQLFYLLIFNPINWLMQMSRH